MEQLSSVIFYTIEKTIKTYRQFAQKRLKAAGLNITVDQWLTLNCLRENPAISQRQLAEMAFKDTASITRIIDLLIKAKLLRKKINGIDKRRTILSITPAGNRLLVKAGSVVRRYRQDALQGIHANMLTNA